MRKIYMVIFARETLAHCVVRQKASFTQRDCVIMLRGASLVDAVEEEGVEDCQAWRCVARIGGTRRAAARAEELESFEHVRCQHRRRAVEEDGVEHCQAWRGIARISGFRAQRTAAFHRGGARTAARRDYRLGQLRRTRYEGG